MSQPPDISADIDAELNAPPLVAPPEEQAPHVGEFSGRIVFPVLFAVGFCHLLNDMMQALFPALYPTLKTELNLSFTQVGLITLTWQVLASMLQPLLGVYADRRPKPYFLAASAGLMCFGLLLLSIARSFPLVLLASAVVGVGSSMFHPEASRVARMASGGRPGMAQSVFQVGGNIGSAIGPLFVAFAVVGRGQASVSRFSLLAVVSLAVLVAVGRWYEKQIAGRAKGTRHAASSQSSLSPRQRASALAILLVLVFSKFIYLTSLTSYYALYLIDRFHVSIQESQIYLFVFLAAAAVGTAAGGPLGDHFGRRYVIWISILGVAPFALAMPYADLTWTILLSFAIGLILSSAFSAIVVFGQDVIPGNVGMVSGMFFGFAFGVAGLGAALLGRIADATSIEFVYRVCSFFPLMGIIAAFLPRLEPNRPR